MSCSDTNKLATLKQLLGVEASDSSQDDLLKTYLDMARQEIINWVYINYAEIPGDAEMPDKYNITQINAVVAGFNLRGGENELRHVENGITREFNYPDMLSYIRAHVFQKVKS